MGNVSYCIQIVLRANRRDFFASWSRAELRSPFVGVAGDVRHKSQAYAASTLPERAHCSEMWPCGEEFLPIDNSSGSKNSLPSLKLDNSYAS